MSWISPFLNSTCADRHEQRALVDRLDDRRVVLDGDDLEVGLRLVEVANGREVRLLVDDAVARARLPEAREHDLFRDGHVLVHHGAAGRRADDAADLVADGDRHLPPAFAPRADPALAPHARVLEQAVLGRCRHRRERVVDQIRAVAEDREAVAILEEVVHDVSLDQLTLLDWKRRDLRALRRGARRRAIPRRAWRRWCDGAVGALPHASAVASPRRRARVLPVRPGAPVRGARSSRSSPPALEIAGSAGSVTRVHRFAVARFGEHALELYWLDGVRRRRLPAVPRRDERPRDVRRRPLPARHGEGRRSRRQRTTRSSSTSTSRSTRRARGTTRGRARSRRGRTGSTCAIAGGELVPETSGRRGV